MIIFKISIFLFLSLNLAFAKAEERSDISNIKGGVNLEEPDDKSVFLGHLLTPTTYLPKKKTVTFGSHITGYSFNDDLLIGTASFLFFFYNSPNLYLKYGKNINDKHRLAVQATYLKSFDSYNFIERKYAMEALMLWGVWSYQATDFYTLHTSFNFMNFYNEGNPHSLRREPFNGQPYQFSITTLHDVRITKKYGLASEFGVLGVNYRIPNLHGAVSFRYMNKNILFQFGISFDVHLPWSSFDKQNYMASHPTLGISNSKEFITHPEIALQYFF